MASEISQQPETIAATVHELRPLVAELRHLAGDCQSVTFYARGSSDTAAVYGRYLCEIEAGIPAALGAPSVATLYGARPDLRATLAVIVSQSGQTTELVEVAEWAKGRGARTVAVTNGPASPLAEAVDLALVTRAGTELAVPATKTHTSQLAALAVLGAGLVDDPARLLAELERAPQEAARLLNDTTAVEETAHHMVAAVACVFTGRAYTLSTALELALKTQETCGLAALGLSAADLQHGPSALERPKVPLVIAAPPSGPALAALAACASTARGRSSPVYVIGGDAGLRSLCDIAIPGPAMAEATAPIVGVIPGQVLVETLARLRGVDPDHPYGLSKVTQTKE